MRLNFPQKSNGIYVLSRVQIDQLATTLLAQFYPNNLIHSTPLNTVHLLQEHLGLNVKRANIGCFNSGILGLTVFGDEVEIPSYDEMHRPMILNETYGTVLISKDLFHADNLPRQRYTEAHEAAHFILHRAYYLQNSKVTANRNAANFQYIACREVGKQFHMPKNDHEWLEWQADHLAAALLMPKEIFCIFIRSTIKNLGISGSILGDDKYTNKREIEEIITAAAEQFNVSKTAAKIRMIHLGLIQKPIY